MEKEYCEKYLKIRQYQKEYREKHKQYYDNYREHNREYFKKWREDHKEELKEYHKKYREENRIKKIRDENKEEIEEARKKHREENKELIQEYYDKTNPRVECHQCNKSYRSSYIKKHKCKAKQAKLREEKKEVQN